MITNIEESVSFIIILRSISQEAWICKIFFMIHHRSHYGKSQAALRSITQACYLTDSPDFIFVGQTFRGNSLMLFIIQVFFNNLFIARSIWASVELFIIQSFSSVHHLFQLSYNPYYPITYLSNHLHCIFQRIQRLTATGFFVNYFGGGNIAVTGNFFYNYTEFSAGPLTQLNKTTFADCNPVHELYFRNCGKQHPGNVRYLATPGNHRLQQ